MIKTSFRMRESAVALKEEAPIPFTLIELLLVVTIITILAGLFLPSLVGIRNKAKEMGCSSNLKQNGMAMASYAGDYNNFLPFLNRALSQSDQNYNWITNIYLDGGYLPKAKHYFGSYMPASGVWLCPIIKVDMISYGTGSNGTGTSYGYNACHVCLCAWNTPRGVRLSNFNRPSSIVYAGDATLTNHGVQCLDSNGKMELSIGIYCPLDRDWMESPGGYNSFVVPPNRHGDGGNICMIDGHVQHGRFIDLKNNLNDCWGHSRR
jgi:prepilin-type processing-associated H-X9-DG protein